MLVEQPIEQPAEVGNIFLSPGEIIQTRAGCNGQCQESNERLKRLEKRMDNIEKLLNDIHKATMKENFSTKLREKIYNMLPISSIEDLRSFDAQLNNKDFKDEFITIGANLRLRDFVKDVVLKEINLKGTNGKTGLKSFQFYKAWKGASGLGATAFKKSMQEQLTAAHNRSYQKERRMEIKNKRKTRPVVASSETQSE